MLPLLGTLLFALIGIAALVIDGGLALTEQARLETAAEMMVSELAFVESVPDGQLPAGCQSDAPNRAQCIERSFLAPLLTPLGVDLVSGAGGSEWRRADRALDGTETIDARGARLGAFDEIETGGSTGTPGPVRLSRSTPLLFGWAAIAPRTQGGSSPDLQTVRSARNAEGLTPDLAGSGLRAEGFALQAEAAIDPSGGARAMRVGPRISLLGGSTGGLIGLAWLRSDLTRVDSATGANGSALGAALNAPGAATNAFRLEGADVVSVANGATVGCLFDPPSSGAHLGQEITISPAVALPGEADAVYVPIVEVCVLRPRILGFLEIGINAVDTANIVLQPGLPARRNASGVPGSAAERGDVVRVWNQPSRIALENARLWQQHGLRVPRVVSDPYAQRRLAGEDASS